MGTMHQVQVHLVMGSSEQSWENGVTLDEEQLPFIAGRQDNVVDDDVDEQPIQDLALNVENVFQADDYDAFDYDVDEAPTAQNMFMANLSSADLVYDKASLSYDSDVLSKVHNHDHYQDAVCEHHEVHEMHDDVQPNYVVESHIGYTSDSNMIPCDQYVKDNTVQVVQSDVSDVPNDAYMIILNDMHEPPAQHVHVTTQTKKENKRLDKHGSWLYKLENLNIPHQVSKAVDEIVTDLVDWAMQAPLRARFSDLPAVDMKKILQQRMFEDKSYKAHVDHKKLYDALEESLERDYSDQSYQIWRKLLPPPPLPPSTGTSGSTQQQGSKALSSSKFAALASQSMAWTTSNIRYDSTGLPGTQELSPTDSLILDDSILDKQIIPSSTVLDVENNWATSLVLAYETPAKNSLLAKTGDMTNFLNWYCQQVNKIVLTPADLEGKAYEMVKEFYLDVIHLYKGRSPALSISKMKAASYPDFGLELLVPEQMRIDDVADLQEHTIAEKDFKNSHPIDFEDLNLLFLQSHHNHLSGSDKRMLSTAVKLWTRNLVIRQWVEDFQLGFNSLVHSHHALSTLRRSSLRTASTAVKPCQGDSLEFYLIT
nr:integrase, catalytic region, zinc finger, CCHC-type, peptidase aspartic, catalytic [Tanacetum cinerariifolium]